MLDLSHISSGFMITIYIKALYVYKDSSNFSFHDSVMRRKGKYVVNSVKDQTNPEFPACCFCRRGKYIVNDVEDSRETLKCCFFRQDSDIKDYQLWVRCNKEDSPYPLIGK